MSRAVTLLPGRGGGHSGDPTGPTQRHTQDGPPERNRQTEAKEEQGAQEANAGGLSWPWPWPRPSARPLQPGPLYPPQSMGQLRGIRSPPGRNTLENIY